MIPASEHVAVQDTVYYTNLTSGRRYTVETQFVLKSDISVVLGSVSKDFYPGAAVFAKDSGAMKGEVTLETEIDTTEYSGESIVAFDYLYEYVKGTKVLIASHTDPEDKAQTLRGARSSSWLPNWSMLKRKSTSKIRKEMTWSLKNGLCAESRMTPWICLHSGSIPQHFREDQ